MAPNGEIVYSQFEQYDGSINSTTVQDFLADINCRRGSLKPPLHQKCMSNQQVEKHVHLE
jgi:hypothetical protein